MDEMPLKVPGYSRKTNLRTTDIKTRYWSFIFDNLRRAVDAIYETCLADRSIIECKEAILILENYRRDFVSLIDYLQAEAEWERSEKPTSIAWEIRKSVGSPTKPVTLFCKSDILTDSIDQISPTSAVSDTCKHDHSELHKNSEDNKDNGLKGSSQVNICETTNDVDDKQSIGNLPKYFEVVEEKEDKFVSKIDDHLCENNASLSGVANLTINTKITNEDNDIKDENFINTKDEVVQVTVEIADLAVLPVLIDDDCKQIKHGEINLTETSLNNEKLLDCIPVSVEQHTSTYADKVRSCSASACANLRSSRNIYPVLVPKSKYQFPRNAAEIRQTKASLGVMKRNQQFLAEIKLKEMRELDESQMRIGRSQKLASMTKMNSMPTLHVQPLNSTSIQRRPSDPTVSEWRTVARRGGRFRSCNSSESLCSLQSIKEDDDNFTILASMASAAAAAEITASITPILMSSVASEQFTLCNAPEKAAKTDGFELKITDNIPDLQTNMNCNDDDDDACSSVSDKSHHDSLEGEEQLAYLTEEERSLAEEERSLAEEIEHLSKNDNCEAINITWVKEKAVNLSEQAKLNELSSDDCLSDSQTWQAIVHNWTSETMQSWSEMVENEMSATVVRAPGKAVETHQKLSSPSRRRPLDDVIMRDRERQQRAEQQRQQLIEQREKNLALLSQRVEVVRTKRAMVVEQKRQLLDARMLRAAHNRQELLQAIVRRAHDEDEKVQEIAFINSLECSLKRQDVIKKDLEAEQRLQTLMEERSRRHEQKVAREAKAEERRKCIEEARKLRLQENVQRRLTRQQKAAERKAAAQQSNAVITCKRVVLKGKDDIALQNNVDVIDVDECCSKILKKPKNINDKQVAEKAKRKRKQILRKKLLSKCSDYKLLSPSPLLECPLENKTNDCDVIMKLDQQLKILQSFMPINYPSANELHRVQRCLVEVARVLRSNLKHLYQLQVHFCRIAFDEIIMNILLELSQKMSFDISLAARCFALALSVLEQICHGNSNVALHFLYSNYIAAFVELLHCLMDVKNKEDNLLLSPLLKLLVTIFCQVNVAPPNLTFACPQQEIGLYSRITLSSVYFLVSLNFVEWLNTELQLESANESRQEMFCFAIQLLIAWLLNSNKDSNGLIWPADVDMSSPILYAAHQLCPAILQAAEQTSDDQLRLCCLQFLATFGSIDPRLLQSALLHVPHAGIQMRQLACSLLSHADRYIHLKCENDSNSCAIFEAMMLVLGHFCVLNVDNQNMMCCGQMPTVLTQLCQFPIIYFGVGIHRHLLLPTLMCCCAMNDEATMKMSEIVNPQLLYDYLEDCLNCCLDETELKYLSSKIDLNLSSRFPKCLWPAACDFFLKF